MSMVVVHTIRKGEQFDGGQCKRDGEWKRLRELIDMKDTLFIRAELPCPRYLGSSSGLTLGHVKQWFGKYLVKMRSPLVCHMAAACKQLEHSEVKGDVGCWGLALRLRDGTDISPDSASVQRVARKFKAEVYKGEAGSVMLRIKCKHGHAQIVQ